MAHFADRTLRLLNERGHDLPDRLGRQLASLQDAISTIARNLGDAGGKRLGEAQHEAEALADSAREHLPVLARQVANKAGRATRALRDDPVPAMVMVGTIALLASLIFREGDR
jgi:ElaB/YqjD/DUF883 family membrane-anchored ribosome-binding protein